MRHAVEFSGFITITYLFLGPKQPNPASAILFLSQLSLGYCGCLLASVGTALSEHSWQFLSPTYPRLQGNLSFGLLAKLKPS
jgi:hypothetical protein